MAFNQCAESMTQNAGVHYVINQGDHSPDTMKFPVISLTIRGTPDHFNWYSYHACITSVKVYDQTVMFIFNDNDFIMITKMKVSGQLSMTRFFP